MRLAQRGFNVLAGVRTTEDEQALSEKGRGWISPVHLDVTDADSIERARNHLTDALPPDAGLFGLVNNAGATVIGPVEVVPLEDLRRQFEINVMGQVAVTQAFLPLLRKAGGRIVNMGSITGRLSFPFAGPYASSKATLAALTDSLRVELKPHGVRVFLIEAGNIKSPIWHKHEEFVRDLLNRLPPDKRSLYKDGLRSDLEMVDRIQRWGASADSVANAVVHAMTSKDPKSRYLVGGDAKLLAVVLKILPDSLRDALVVRFMGPVG